MTRSEQAVIGLPWPSADRLTSYSNRSLAGAWELAGLQKMPPPCSSRLSS